MSEVVIDIDESTDERFFAAIEKACARGRVVSFDVCRSMRPIYNRFHITGYTSHGGTAHIIVDVDDDVEEEPLFV